VEGGAVAPLVVGIATPAVQKVVSQGLTGVRVSRFLSSLASKTDFVISRRNQPMERGSATSLGGARARVRPWLGQERTDVCGLIC
jgi:hypothetical protein